MPNTAPPIPTRFEFKSMERNSLGTFTPRPTVASLSLAQCSPGPLTSVKEQSTGMYAAALASRGYEALAFDHRTFGESGGEPRQFENPFAKVEDIRGAVTALEERSHNSSADGRRRHLRRRWIYGQRGRGRRSRFDAFAGSPASTALRAPDAKLSPSVLRGRAAEEEWRETGHAEMIPAVGPDGGNVAMPLREAYKYYGTPRGAVPNYINGYRGPILRLHWNFRQPARGAADQGPCHRHSFRARPGPGARAQLHRKADLAARAALAAVARGRSTFTTTPG